MAWFIPFVISIALEVVSVLLTPKPKTTAPGAPQDAQYPTASAGTPMIVVSGTMTTKAPNVLDYMDKATYQHDVNV